jgi:hypothetical protein
MARKPAHYRGRYHVAARRVRQLANADPRTLCWRCGRTLAQHPPHKGGRPAYWQAGHVVDGQANGALRPEASTCNLSAGGKLGAEATARKRKPRTSARW